MSMHDRHTAKLLQDGLVNIGNAVNMHICIVSRGKNKGSWPIQHTESVFGYCTHTSGIATDIRLDGKLGTPTGLVW